MQVTLMPGPMTTYNGVRCRAWYGRTDGGVPVTLFACGLAVEENQATAEFDAVLQEAGQPVELDAVLRDPRAYDPHAGGHGA